MKTLLGFVFVLISLAFPTKALASTFYVDNDLAGNCSGNYSLTSRNCTGSDGNAYKTISSGLGALSAGDTLYIRSGSYSTTANTIDINGSETTISGYQNEIATISKTSIRQPLLGLSDSTANIKIKNLTFEGTLYQVISGSWTNIVGNVWTITLTPQPTQIRFNTTIGTEVGSSGEVNGVNKWYWSSNTLYIYSGGDPTTSYTNPGINQTDNYDAIAIGNPSGTAGNLITIDNCVFSNFSHTAIKGNFKFHILNSRFSSIGTDDNDHNIYLTGEQSENNESIIEYNEFNYTPGALIHLYSHPAYVIVRYNILNGKNGSSNSTWGILLSGNHLKVYNNSFYGNGFGVSFYTSNSHDNQVTNNIFYGSSGSDYYIDTYGDSFFPVNNTSTYNYFGSNTKCSGCTDKTSSGGDNYTNYITGTNTQDDINPFSGSSFTSIEDYLLPNDSNLIDYGYNLGTENSYGFSNQDVVWPITLIDQNENGSGWDLGAYISYVAPHTPLPENTSLSQPSSNGASFNSSCHDPQIFGSVNLFLIKQFNNSLTLYYTGVKNATKYLIFYGNPKTPEQFATVFESNSSAVISTSINNLNSNSEYQFKIVPSTNCSTGKNSNTLRSKTTGKYVFEIKPNLTKTENKGLTDVSKEIKIENSPRPSIGSKIPEKQKSFVNNFWSWIKNIFTP